MRVLRTNGSDKEDWIPRLCTHKGQPYAILSHRWLQDANHEILFADIEEIDVITGNKASGVTHMQSVKNAQCTRVSSNFKPGFAKLKGAAQQALQAGYDYIWVDTCCIDKNSSAELSEAINSMWRWYSTSAVCYVYLGDVLETSNRSANSQFAKSQWWKRGWTLQELLAPRQLTFFSSTWEVIGYKKGMDQEISMITGISPNVINGTISLYRYSIAQRMSWASDRVTSRSEDMAYCLMGLFSIHMPLLYGEGENAFLRLQQEIMKNSDDETIFAWQPESNNMSHGLLADGPSAFSNSRNIVPLQDAEYREPFMMTSKGVSVTLQLHQLQDFEGFYRAILQCADTALGGRPVGICLQRMSETSEQYARSGRHREAAFQTDHMVKTIYVKQSHNPYPVHRVPSRYPQNISLLRVVPSKDPSTVKAELVQADIETARYTTLAYQKGRSQRRQTIWVEDQPFQVAETVFQLLQKVGCRFGDELVMADGACFRQGTQWKMWLDGSPSRETVYDHASKIVVWMEDVPRTHRELQAIPSLAELQLLLQRTSPSNDTPVLEGSKDELIMTCLQALMDIETCPYWSQRRVLHHDLSKYDNIIIESRYQSFRPDSLHLMYTNTFHDLRRRHPQYKEALFYVQDGNRDLLPGFGARVRFGLCENQ